MTAFRQGLSGPISTGFALVLAFAVFVLGAPSCTTGGGAPSIEPPTISSLELESTNVTAGLTISMGVVAVGTGNLGYQWTSIFEGEEDSGEEESSAGEFTEPEAASTTWTAPQTEGMVLVSIQVVGAGGISTMTVPVLVGPGIDEDGDGFALVEGDCDDENVDVYPGAPELQDTIDNDCDGEVDEGAEDVDDDQDGYTDLQGDCDDTDPTVYPGAQETVDGLDQNCNTIIDDQTTAYDDDGDGFSEEQGDCDDTNSSMHPASTELLDTVDNDCDGLIDENTVGSDDDGDGYTELEGDCDDGDTDTYPGATELPDGADNDCNGLTDDGSFIMDDDGDGYTDLAGDCDDTNPYTYPGAPEYLDGQDNDCDGSLDEGLDSSDDDGDGFSEADGDCNDSNDAIYPGAMELDDGIDNDCDGLGYTSPPVAIGSVVGDPEACAPVQLTAVNSYDPDGDPLDFTWFFTSVPPISQLTDDDITDRYEMEASFVPDSAGYWAVAIQVTDGTYTSAPATVGFTVGERAGNIAPVAAFVESNMVEIGDTPGCSTDAYGVCTGCDPCAPTYTLDASASSDGDEDPLWYTFSAQKLSGDGGNPELTPNGDGTVSVTFSMSVGCAPDLSNGLYEVEVQVHDCNGVTDTASVQIAYSCQSQ